jgi:phosphotransferase system enzyme I (PtsP)
MAGDPVGAVLLIALGFRVLSMSATNLLKVKAILRQVSMSEVEQLLEEVMVMPDAQAVWKHMEKALKKPEVSGLFRRSDFH